MWAFVLGFTDEDLKKAARFWGCTKPEAPENSGEVLISAGKPAGLRCRWRWRSGDMLGSQGAPAVATPVDTTRLFERNKTSRLVTIPKKIPRYQKSFLTLASLAILRRCGLGVLNHVELSHQEGVPCSSHVDPLKHHLRYWKSWLCLRSLASKPLDQKFTGRVHRERHLKWPQVVVTRSK